MPVPPIGLVVASQCTFPTPVSFPQVLELGLRVVSLGRSSVTYEVGFFSDYATGKEEGGVSSAQDVATAVGGYTHVFVDRVHRRPVKEMNATLRSGLETISTERSTKGKL